MDDTSTTRAPAQTTASLPPTAGLEAVAAHNIGAGVAETAKASGATFGGMTARSSERLHAPRIALRNLDFFYGTSKALKGIELDIPERQVTGMIGPSGCGKSTLLRVLNRM